MLLSGCIELDAEGLEARKAQEWKMAKMAVEKTIEVMRAMVVDGRL